MLKNHIKSLVKKKMGGNNKKNIENLIVFLVLLIITIIAINLIWGEEKNKSNIDSDENQYKILAQKENEGNISEDTAYNLESKLQDILSKISGVGKVQVLVTYSETSQVIAMHNEVKNTSITEENDSNRWNKSNRSFRRKQRNSNGFRQ